MARADDKVEEARALTIGSTGVVGGVGGSVCVCGGVLNTPSQLGNPQITCGEAAKEIGVSGNTARRVFNGGIGCKPLRQMAAQGAKPEASQNRLRFCRGRSGQIESGEPGSREFYRAVDMLFRLGLFPAGGSEYE